MRVSLTCLLFGRLTIGHGLQQTVLNDRAVLNLNLLQACHTVAMAIRKEFKHKQKLHTNHCGRIQQEDADNMTPPTLDMLNRLLITNDIESLEQAANNISTRTKVTIVIIAFVLCYCVVEGEEEVERVG